MGSGVSTIPGLPLCEKYKIVHPLHNGNNSVLYLVQNTARNSLELIKSFSIVSIPPGTVDTYITAIQRIQALSYSPLVKYSTIEKQNGYIFISMNQYQDSLNSINPVNNFKEQGLYPLLNEISEALHQLHRYDFTHGNIKPSNILISETGHFYLSDYCENMLYVNTVNGIPIIMSNCHYLSPETLCEKELKKESDLFSFGCVLYYLVSGKHPFNGKSIMEVINNVCNCNYEKLEDNNLNDLISKLLIKESDERLNINKIIKEIKIIYKINQNNDLNNKYPGLDKGIRELIDKKASEYNPWSKTELDFNGCRISDLGICYLCEKITEMNGITKLLLRTNGITNDGLKRLCEHLKFIPKLSILWLFGNQISDDGIKYLSDNLKSVPNLTQLEVTANQISSVGFNYLSDHIVDVPKLERLWLFGNKMCDYEKIKSKIMAEHPNKGLKIYIKDINN